LGAGAPTYSLLDCFQLATPEGFSASCLAPAYTIPGSLTEVLKPTRFHHRFWSLGLSHNYQNLAIICKKISIKAKDRVFHRLPQIQK
jgi:hypothetical protein